MIPTRERNNFTSLEGDLKPRELMERAADLSIVPDEALLAVLLKTGVQGLNVVELSRRLIEAFGSLKMLVSADWRTLEFKIASFNDSHPRKKILGLGHVKCLELAAAFEMGRRWLRLSSEELKAQKVDDAESAYRVFKAVLNPADENENVYVLLLDLKCRPMCEPICAIRGEGASSVFSPREVFKEAVRWGASAVIVAHNHPSGDVNPSNEDVEITRRLVILANVVGIPLVDHLIVSGIGAGYLSLRETHPDAFEPGDEFGNRLSSH